MPGELYCVVCFFLVVEKHINIEISLCCVADCDLRSLVSCAGAELVALSRYFFNFFNIYPEWNFISFFQKQFECGARVNYLLAWVQVDI